MQHLDVIAALIAAIGILAFGLSRLIASVDSWQGSAYQRETSREAARQYHRDSKRLFRHTA